jgi:hypothetical protein
MLARRSGKQSFDVETRNEARSQEDVASVELWLLLILTATLGLGGIAAWPRQMLRNRSRSLAADNDHQFSGARSRRDFRFASRSARISEQ